MRKHKPWMRKWQPSDPPALIDRVWDATRGDPNLTPRLTAVLGWLIEECRRRAELEQTGEG